MKTIVTTAEIEEVGESLILDFLGNFKTFPKFIDIERFIQEYLQLSIVYERFAEDDRDKLGFVSDGKYPIRIFVNGKKEAFVYPQGTIVIDRFLLDKERSGRKRFTLAHEAAHVILERMSPMTPGPCFNRYFDLSQDYDVEELQKRMNLYELQADQMAAVLLMPRFLMNRTMRVYRREMPVIIYGSGVISSKDKQSLQTMSQRLDVSFSALLNRLRTLGYIEMRPMTEYVEKEMNFGDGK